MNTKMFVVTHKKTAIPELPAYVSLFVGAHDKQEKESFDYCDDLGDNISDKNKFYCELTGVYWVWKNVEADIVGFCHYRRFFTKNPFINNVDWYLQKRDIETLLENCDVIVPAAMIYEKSVLQKINYAPNLDDMRELHSSISTLYPDYLEDYYWYLNQNKSHLYNMVVMKKGQFDQYCEWLFSILSHVEKHHEMDKETDDYRKRLFGFLSERLLNVWLHHNIKRLRIKEIHVLHSELSVDIRLRRYIGNIYREIIYMFIRSSKEHLMKQEDLMRYISDRSQQQT